MTLEQKLALAFLEEHPSEAAQALERMPVDGCAAIVRSVPAAAAAALAEMLPSAVADCVARLSPGEAADALDHLPLDRAIGVLRRLPPEHTNHVVAALPAARQDLVQRVLKYPEGTAGALMDPIVAELPADLSVAEARVRLRRGSAGLLHYLFVVDRSRVLVGMLEISDLLRASGRASIDSLMRDGVDSLPAWMPAAAVRTHPGWQSAHVLPVVDEAGRLVGSIRWETLRRLEREAETRQDPRGAAATVGALGELFHLGLAGFIEGVASAGTPRPDSPGARRDGEEAGR